MKTVTVIGECMLEHLAAEPHQPPAVSGDTYNTAVYLARCSSPDRIDVGYVTALGDDPGSGAILRAMRAEGIDEAGVIRLPGRRCGVYWIHTDAAGERSFTYDRAHSAATELFGDLFPGGIDARLAASDVIYLSGITLQIMAAPARTRLFDHLAAARARGSTIVFDSNFRAAAWPDTDAARDTFETILRITDIALSSFADEAALFGDPDPAACADRLEAAGVKEIVIKDGNGPAYLRADGESDRVPAEAVPVVVDTTAAGDSFNAAYLAARLTGSAAPQAVSAGHRLASLVVQHRGAIVSPDVLAARGPRSGLHGPTADRDAPPRNERPRETL